MTLATMADERTSVVAGKVVAKAAEANKDFITAALRPQLDKYPVVTPKPRLLRFSDVSQPLFFSIPVVT